MRYEKYDNLLSSPDLLEYEFLSMGPCGNIMKSIKFEPTLHAEIFNLAFGNPKPDGTIDDLVINNNKDRNKILATVAHSVRLFCSKYSDKWIHFAGSTPERTRLYRMAITLNIEELSAEYDIMGILKDTESYVSIPFVKNLNYFGFLIKKKIS